MATQTAIYWPRVDSMEKNGRVHDSSTQSGDSKPANSKSEDPGTLCA